VDELRDKVAVITGGASGIGFASAAALARERVKLVLADIEGEALGAAVAKLRAGGAEAIGVATDVTSRAAVEALADAAWQHYGRADIVFNNAGVAVAGAVATMKHEDWRWVIDVDLWGVIHGVEAFVPRLVEQKQGGHVLATASFAGLVPNVGLGAYCVAKYGVVALMEVLHKELRGHGIGASVLCPMRVRTAIDDSGRNRQADYGGPEAQSYPKLDESQMAGRVIDVEDVAALVVRGIRRGNLYLLPHEESRAAIRRRFERIDRAFEGRAG
jgi:NAD(P)-dependent dehydrogenase (short-subunit alcohol dehydrogenase family)